MVSMITIDDAYLNDCPELILRSHIDLSIASNPKILYKKPDGVTGNWIAIIVEQNITYQPTTEQIDLVGIWTLQAYIEIDGLPFHGDPVRMVVKSLPIII